MKTPEEMTDAELNEAVAVEVAGWRHTVASEKMGTRWWVDENGGHISPYNDPDSGCSFATSADAVMPLLNDKCNGWQSCFDQGELNEHTVNVWAPDFAEAEAESFPRAACIALLKAARAKKDHV